MLLWADSFDHYGGVFANMFFGAWSSHADSSGVPFLTNLFSRSGTYSLAFTGTNGSGSVAQHVRRSLPSAKTRCGFGYGLYQPNLPSTNEQRLFQILNSSASPILTLCAQSDGSIHIRKGDFADPVIEISDSVLTPGTFHHIELWQTFDTVAGEIEVRVNEQTVIADGGINLGAAPAASVQWRKLGSNNEPFYVDDVFAADDQGAENNTFIGAQRMITEFPLADTAQADWTLNGSGTGHGCIDQTGPDGDLTYLSSAIVGHKSDFTLPSLPPELAVIAGVYVPVMARINAAGIGNLKTSMKSAAALAAGNDNPLTPGYTYYGDAFEVDPNTGLPWTKSGLEAALLRLEKTL